MVGFEIAPFENRLSALDNSSSSQSTYCEPSPFCPDIFLRRTLHRIQIIVEQDFSLIITLSVVQ